MPTLADLARTPKVDQYGRPLAALAQWPGDPSQMPPPQPGWGPSVAMASLGQGPGGMPPQAPPQAAPMPPAPPQGMSMPPPMPSGPPRGMGFQGLSDDSGPPPPTERPPTGPPPPDGTTLPGGGNTTAPPPWRNPPGSENPSSSRQAPRLVQENGQWFLTEHGNRRGPLSPSEVIAAQGYVNDYWRRYPTGFQPGVGPQTNNDYPPPGSTTGARGWAGTSTIGLNLTPPPSANSGATWAGFNNDRALAGGDPDSVKDAFFRWTTGLNFNPAGHTKEEIEAFLRSQIDNARAYGITILDVRGDSILVETRERGPEWVDVVQNAGGTGASPWTWQAADGTSTTTTGTTPPTTNTTPLTPKPGDPPPTVAKGVSDAAPIYNSDGTVSLRISPEAYLELVDQYGEVTPPPVIAPKRRSLADLRAYGGF